MILDEIVANKRQEIEAQLRRVPLAQLEEAIGRAEAPRDFRGALRAPGISLISDPSGKGMGLEVAKELIPFQNLTLLGLWFIDPYGVLQAALAYGLWTAKPWPWSS